MGDTSKVHASYNIARMISRRAVLLGAGALGLAAQAAGPAMPDSVRTVKEYITWARAHPSHVHYATTSAGGTPHFVGVMLARDAKVELVPVHYKGGAPALQDLMGGQIPVSVNPISELLPYAGARIRVLAVTAPKRSRYLPDVPTMAESGFPDIVI